MLCKKTRHTRYSRWGLRYVSSIRFGYDGWFLTSLVDVSTAGFPEDSRSYPRAQTPVSPTLNRRLEREALRCADYLTPNETELARLTGMAVATDEEVVQACESLQGRQRPHDSISCLVFATLSREYLEREREREVSFPVSDETFGLDRFVFSEEKRVDRARLRFKRCSRSESLPKTL